MNTGKKYTLIIGIALLGLIVLTGGGIRNDARRQAGLAAPLSQTPTPGLTASTDPATARPQYHKKVQVFKRVVAEPDYSSIRISAATNGYKALSGIPAFAMVQQFSVRVPQFPDSFALGNYQALSTLGTQQYYSNLQVQEYFNTLSDPLYLTELRDQQYWNNMDTQTYLNNMKTWENTTVLNAQQYLTSLNNQIWMNNYNNQQYLNNFNSYNSFNTWHTYSPPTFYNPPIYNPPTFYNPPSFNFSWP